MGKSPNKTGDDGKCSIREDYKEWAVEKGILSVTSYYASISSDVTQLLNQAKPFLGAPFIVAVPAAGVVDVVARGLEGDLHLGDALLALPILPSITRIKLFNRKGELVAEYTNVNKVIRKVEQRPANRVVATAEAEAGNAAKVESAVVAEQRAATTATNVAPKVNPQGNLTKSRVFESKSQDAVEKLGETVIVTQQPKGAVDLGFDFVSFTGKGAEAKLVINEAKEYTKAVGAHKFSSFGLGAKATNEGKDTLNQSIDLARRAIQDANIDLVTKRELIRQLDTREATVRIIGTSQTKVTDEVRKKIAEKSGFKIKEGVFVP